MLDHYIYGSVERISPEAPVAIVSSTSELDTLGGCGNVIKNLLNLGVDISLVSAIGSDPEGTIIKSKLVDAKVPVSGVLVSNNIRTTHKMRIIGQKQQMLRIDRDAKPLTPPEYKELECLVKQGLQYADAVLISDYNKGVCIKQLTQSTIRLSQEKKIPVYIDPKGKDWDKYAGATLITPNISEAETIVGRALVSNEDFEEAGKEINSKYNIQASLITRGCDGMSYIDGKKNIHLLSKAMEVFDVSGAGDTVIACLTAAHVSNVPIEQSVEFSNIAAGIVVGHSGTTPISAQKLNSL